MAFPLDPLTLQANKYIPFLAHGGKFRGTDIQSGASGRGIAPSNMIAATSASSGQYSLGALDGTVLQFDTAVNTTTGQLGAVGAMFGVQSGQSVAVGDIVEINAFGLVRTAQTSSVTAFGIAATSGSTTSASIFVQTAGLCYGANTGNSASLVVGQYATVASSGTNLVTGTTALTNRFGRILTSSASTSGSSLILIQN